MVNHLKIIFLLYLLSTSVLYAHSTKKKALKSHEHGVGVLNIAQEGNSVIFEFEIPGFDIVGFEYEAKEEDDINKVENALEILSDYKNMIMPSGSAECEKLESSAEVINEGKHSEFISSYRFNCKKISDLKIIYIKYFNNFENSKKLNIKVFGNNKKTAYVITKSKKILNVKDHFDN